MREAVIGRVRRHALALALLSVASIAAATAAECTGREPDTGVLRRVREWRDVGLQKRHTFGSAAVAGPRRSWAWRATNPNGTPSYAYHRLPASYNEVWVEAWVYLVSHQSSVKLFAVRPVGQRSLDVYVDTRNRVSVRNNIGAVTTHAQDNHGHRRLASRGLARSGGRLTGCLDVSVDGTAVPGLSLTGQKLGFLPFGEMRLGDTATAATFDLILDDIVVSTSVP